MKYKTQLTIKNLKCTIEYTEPHQLEAFTNYFNNDTIEQAIDNLNDTIDQSQKTLKDLAILTGISRPEICKLANKYSILDRINHINQTIKDKIKCPQK